ncbi:MAG: UDPGP type 1 family protein [Clostridia bacterium]|nr:UDPGP type 1 family protein [Clostridia bacterium]
MTYQEAKAVLAAEGQEHLLAYWEELSEGEQESLLSQIASVDWSLLTLVREHRSEEETRGHLEPLGALEVAEIEAQRAAFEARGIEALKAEKVGAVLLAGGQGTRLGLDKPKGMLDVGVTHTLYLFERLIHNIMDVVNRTGAWMPLYIMTSQKNNDDTVNFFREHDYFGYHKDYIRFFMQEMVPSVDYNGKILMEGKGQLSMSPNGNGGWFTSLAKAGYLAELKARGVEWLTVFSVDNVLQRINDPCFVGATLASGCDCGAKVVRKAAPDERVGVLCLEDGKPSIVEYYEMTEEMLTSRRENGDLSYNFGVILNYMFRLATLEETMNRHMPVHIVEKKIPYIDEAGELQKPTAPNGYKFETLVLDMVRMMRDCLSFEVVREREFAPIKNREGVDSLVSARELLRQNGVEL